MVVMVSRKSIMMMFNARLHYLFFLGFFAFLFGCHHMNKDTIILNGLLKTGLVEGTAEKPLIFKSAEVEDVDASKSRIENIVFDGLSAAYLTLNESSIRNVEFKDCLLYKLYLKKADVENVRFTNCRIESLNIQGANLTDIQFNNSEINSVSFLLSKGNVKITKSRFSKARLNDASITWDIESSNLNSIEAYGIQGSITLTNSTLKDANFDFGEMDSFESYNSVVDALGPGTINEHLIIKGGQVEWVGVMNAKQVHLDSVDIERFTMTNGKIGNVLIEDCKNAGLIGFSQSTIESLTIKNCKMEWFRSYLTVADVVSFSNVSMQGLSMPDARFNEWRLDHVKMAGEIKTEDAVVGKRIFNELTIVPNAKLLSSGANFSFTD